LDISRRVTPPKPAPGRKISSNSISTILPEVSKNCLQKSAGYAILTRFALQFAGLSLFGDSLEARGRTANSRKICKLLYKSKILAINQQIDEEEQK
jgi:hypothetical protein